ncbi:glycosyltransferase family 2 protein [Polynucleobacter sp. AP-Latsch-80-C2]|uniref:glycosyltransferase family 2 protein n=1 Tax=Polynucleobacter sp. AP-Latsch-80-C2 TaxID=2576931 RepID=UPI001C0E221D|nr:glycosyltransferase family 2 protein [Polynucleobacter sp. AP-Latsch-80-C2]MBU3624386.1 glycosyltransferase family 2 protein [Polynucleobacter sp. AP-Latsch-80-C2]
MASLISLSIPCYNEEENVDELYRRICETVDKIIQYQFEFVFIDNASEDQTVQKLIFLASTDRRVKIIVNTRNFGHIRSPYWGIMQTSGDATIALASDLQDPPELIPQFISQWELGWKVVLAVKPRSKTNFFVHKLRRLYYQILDGIANIDLVKDATGFGLYDKKVLDQVRKISDPYPYLRGLICELGFPIKTIPFLQPRRERGISKNNFYTLYDIAMLGIVSHSLVPIRLASICGIVIGFMSLLVAIFYTIMKLLNWYSFPVGMAPIVIGIFLLFSLLFIFIGILGEYIGSIHSYVKNRPIVVERERINFEE